MNEREIFINAPADATPDVLGTYLAEACGDDHALRRRVESLIAAERAAGREFLGKPPMELVDAGENRAAAAGDRCGEAIGGYRIVREIGEGGCGIVYLAEQLKPVRRRVALKIIKPGMDTRQVVARFEAERQALALMDHPNIARVLDAGATDGGRPYFVMELVHGVPITTFCDERRFDTRRRLELFRDVCAAVNHAHQKGIIHRDLKPSNVMVTLQDDRPVVKVIDFGVAKATRGELTEKTLFTRFEQMMGTPVYMSPEQAQFNGLDIDTRADIYSLGVLLYELLAGSAPFDLRTLGTTDNDEMRRIIREVDPPRPSLRVVSFATGEDHRRVAEAHGSEPGRIARTLRGDLDWIVMKAIEKDRTRRYETASALSADIARHLSGVPVEAGAPSAAYRLRKFAARHAAALGVAAAFCGLMAAATAISTWYAWRARDAERVAEGRLAESESAREEAEAVLGLLTELIQSPDPTRNGRNVTIAEVLDRAAESLERDLASQPVRRARLQGILGYTYRALGMFRESAAMREAALAGWRQVRSPDHPDTLAAMTDLAYSYRDIDQCEKALELSEQVLEARRRTWGSEDPATLQALRDLAFCQQRLGRLEEAMASHRTEVGLRRRVHGPRSVETARAMEYLATSCRYLGRHDEAMNLREEAAAICRDTLGADGLDTLRAVSRLAESCDDVGRADRAMALRREVLQRATEAFGAEVPFTLFATGELARSVRLAGEFEESIRLCEREVEGRQRINGASHPDTLNAIRNLVSSMEAAGRSDAALELRKNLVRLHIERFGADHSETVKAMNNLAAASKRSGLSETADPTGTIPSPSP